MYIISCLEGDEMHRNPEVSCPSVFCVRRCFFVTTSDLLKIHVGDDVAKVSISDGALETCWEYCLRTFKVMILVVRIARPTSLAIWHRGRSHRRPNRSGSPNRRHFASLDLKKHPDFSHPRPTSQDFRRLFFWHFPVISDQANVFSHR